MTADISALDLEEAGAVLAAESARFASFGWMRGTSGNLSVVLSRDPLRLAVTASGHDKGELTPADVVLVDGRGAAVNGGKPSAEAELHARVAALTGRAPWCTSTRSPPSRWGTGTRAGSSSRIWRC